jgi:hypothetical protein
VAQAQTSSISTDSPLDAAKVMRIGMVIALFSRAKVAASRKKSLFALTEVGHGQK